MKKQLLTLGLSVMGASMISVAASAQVLDTQTANDYLHFSFPIAQSNKLDASKAFNAISNEYHMEVTGAQLNKGIILNTTQSKVAILVSNAGQSSALDTGLLQLKASGKSAESLIDKRVSSEQLAQVGMFSNTVALTTRDDAAFGALTLKTEQSLSLNDKYIVQVKEKNSPYTLSVSLPTQSYTEGDKVIARGAMMNRGNAFAAGNTTAQLVAPNGEVSQVSVKVNGTELEFAAAEQANIIAPINGLYELRVQSAGNDKGTAVRRNAKVAFALARDTASLNGVSMGDNDGLFANVRLLAKEAGRFEVRGVLFGTNDRGQLVPVMETHAAQNTNAGADSIKLPFDAAILAQAGVKAPYELRDVRLFDQKQMGLIDNLGKTVTFGGNTNM